MERQRSNQDTPKSTNWQTPHSKFSLHPELSEDPNYASLNTSATKNMAEKSGLNPLDYKFGTNSVQASTQHSLNLKHSFSMPGVHMSKELSESYPYNPSAESSLKSSLKYELKNILKEVNEDEKEQKESEENQAQDKHRRIWKSEDFDSQWKNEDIDKEFKASQEVTVFEGDLQIPQLKWCAYCKAEVMTEVVYVNNGKTFWSAVGIFLSGGFLGCFLLPYMSNSCKGVKVMCHNCGRVLN